MYAVDYKSPRPSPKLAARGGMMTQLFPFKADAEAFATKLKARGIAATVRPVKKSR